MSEAAVATARYRISAVRPEARDIVSIRLKPESGTLPAFTAGAHVRIRLGPGIVRAYSLCNGPGDADAYVIAVKREPASTGGSAAVHRLREGDVVEVGAPRNDFEVSWRSRHLVLIAGGIGITPMISMAREAAERGHSFELHYFARSVDAAAFADELAGSVFSARVAFHFGLDAAAVEKKLDAILDGYESGREVYVCGPRALIDRVRAITRTAWPSDSVHWESFGGTIAPADPSDRPVEVRLARTGVTIQVPSDQTILQALIAQDVDVPFSCREGQCGMCVVDVIEGEPDHRDDFLNAAVKASGDCMALCVSRAKTPSLVIDL